MSANPGGQLFMKISRVLAGAAIAAEQSGESAKALEYYRKVVAIADGADEARAEIADARVFLGKH